MHSSYHEEGNCLKTIHLLARTGGYTLIVLSILASIYAYVRPQDRAGGMSQLLGALSLLVAFATISIWIVRRIYIEIKKRNIPDFNIAKTTLLILKKHHVLLGWATLLTATAHGLFYILHYPNRSDRIYTGLLAWTALILLMVFGTWLDYRLTVRVRAKQIRMYHVALASLFMITMIIHA